MCGSRCAVMTVITVAVRLISHLMCPFPSSSCSWKPAGSAALNRSLSLVHAITAADMRSSRTFIKQTRFSSRAAANKRPQLSIQVRMTAQHNSGKRADSLFSRRRPRAVVLEISTSGAEGEETGVLSAFVGRGSIRRRSLSSHLLDSISSSVTSADYVSSKQPATRRLGGAIMLRV